MEHESFNDSKISAMINSNFIPVRVDRDERRDVDLLYTMYYEATTGQSGWPLNVFLDPKSLAPFFGGNYWPSSVAILSKPHNPHHQHATPASFEKVLSSISEAWKNSPEKCTESANAIKERLAELYRLQNGAEKANLKLSVFDSVGTHFRDHFDVNYGGLTNAPKFLLPHNLSFLLKYSDLVTPDPQKDARPSYQKTHSLSAKEMASVTLKKMGEGAIKDQIGNGFHHYSVTDDWSLPQFEKQLIDQALMLNAYVYAYQADPVENRFALEYMEDLIRYMSKGVDEGGLKSKQGGLILGEDPDSVPSETAIWKESKAGAEAQAEELSSEYKPYEKVEGAYYTWQSEDFAKPLSKLETDIAEAFYGVKDMGNINEEMDSLLSPLAYQNTLFQSMGFKELAQYFGISEQQAREMITEKVNPKLEKFRRETRDMPLKDERVFAGYNGAAITGLANAAIALGGAGGNATENAKSTTMAELGKVALENAKEIANFVYEHMYDKSTSTLARYYLTSGREGPSKVSGMLDDYAYMIQGLIALYTCTFDTFYLDFAKQLQDAQFVKFWDIEKGGFFYSEVEAGDGGNASHANDSCSKPTLFLRSKPSFDSSEPSANGVSCENLFKLSGLLHDSFYSDKAIETLECFGKDIEAQPFGYCSMLGAVAAYLRRGNKKGSMTTVLVVGGEGRAGAGAEQELYQLRQHLYNGFVEGSLTMTSFSVCGSDPRSELEINGKMQRRTKVPNIVPNLMMLRLTQADVDKYYEPYGNALYGALVDKYAQGRVKYVVVRNMEVAEPVESLEELLDGVFEYE